MNIKQYENFLTKSIFLFPLSMLLMGIIVTSVIFFVSIKTFQKIELTNIKQNLLKENKDFLKKSVSNIDEDIKISIKSLINQEKSKAKLDIETISETLLSIYETYNKSNKKEFISKVLDSVNKIRKRHYFGVIDMQTKIMIIHPINKVLNKDTSKMMLGQYSLYKWVVKTIKNPKQEGYFTVTFYKPNKKKQVTKIVFVKYLKALNWAIGTGEYLDEILKTIKTDIIKKIMAKKGNFSVIDLNDNILFNHKEKKLINSKFLNKIQSLKDGKFIQNSKQLTYALYNPELNLVIQNSIDLEKINNFIQKEYQKVDKIYQHLYNILFINIAIIIFLSTFISIIVSRKIKEVFKIYEKTNNEKMKAEYEANHDILTNAYNRSFFNKTLKEKFIQLKNDKEKFSLVILDIDYFKKINDTYGHQEGDQVLKKFVKFIQSNLREKALFARWGGEEFVVIFEHLSSEEVKKRFEIIKNKLLNDENMQNPVKFSFSAGISEYIDGDTEDSLLKKADKALYEAKKTRNTIFVYNQ